MRRFLAVFLALGLILSLAGCGQGNVTGVENGQIVTEEDEVKRQEAAQSEAEKENVTDADVDDSLEGLEQYLTAAGAIAENPTKVEMESSFVGAEKGYKYNFSYEGNNNIRMELYEYDPENLNEIGKEVFDGIKSKGTFSVLGIEVTGYLSNNEKYLLIYTDTINDDAKVHENHTQEVIKLFQEFKDS